VGRRCSDGRMEVVNRRGLRLAGAVLLGLLVHPFVGSGRTCDGIGFGCTPERDTDTLLIVVVYTVAALVTLVVAWRRSRRGRRWRTALVAGIAITMLATGAAAWSQLPRYPTSPGPLSAAGERWERVLADGRAVASPGTPLGDTLRDLERRRPLICRDAYGRSTGTRGSLVEPWHEQRVRGLLRLVRRAHRDSARPLGRPPARAWRLRERL